MADHDPNRPVVVAIAGGSATGKTTLARALAASLSDPSPLVVNQDRYFRDFAEYTPEERERVRTAILHRESIGRRTTPRSRR